MYISNISVEMSGRGPRRVDLELCGVNSKDVYMIYNLYHSGNEVDVNIIPNNIIPNNILKSILRMETSVYGLTSAKFASHGKENKNMVPYIKKVIFNNPATIVFWSDGTKTVAKAHGEDKFDKEIGLTVCIAKKAMGNKKKWDQVFKKWIKE